MSTNTIPVSVRVGITALKGYAVGDTIEARFRNVVQHVDDGCWMTIDEDERFRACVGATMISYATDSPEFHRLQREMQAIQRMSAFLSAASAGLRVDLPDHAEEDAHIPIGLLAIWREQKVSR